MANNYNKEKLVKVGMEGFAMLDECLGRKRESALDCYKNAKICGGTLPHPKDSASALDCYDDAKIYGVNAPQRLLPPPPQVLWRYPHQPQEPHVYVVAQFSYPTKDNMSAMDCYEVAKIYGGTLLVDYPKRKPTRMAYY